MPAAGRRPFPLDYVIAPDGTVAYFKTEYDPERMVQVIDSLLEKSAGIQIDPTALDFAAVQLGESALLPLRVDNLGDGELVIGSILSDHSDFEANLDELILPPGASGSLLVEFAPSELGPISATLTLASNDPLQAELTVPLSGQGVSATSADPPQARFALLPARPNPFSDGTALRFVLPESGQVRLGVYDLRGRLLRRILEPGERLEAGEHHRAWNGRDQDGNRLASGVYFIKLEWGDRQATRKLLLLR